MKLNLTFVGRTERTSTRTGKPFTSISIKCKEYGDKFLSGFGNKDNAGWKEGMEVEVEAVTPKGQYLNFEMPKTSKANNTGADPAILGKIILDLGNMHRKLDMIINHLNGSNPLHLTSAGTKVPDFSEVDDIGPVESFEN